MRGLGRSTQSSAAADGTDNVGDRIGALAMDRAGNTHERIQFPFAERRCAAGHVDRLSNRCRIPAPNPPVGGCVVCGKGVVPLWLLIVPIGRQPITHGDKIHARATHHKSQEGFLSSMAHAYTARSEPLIPNLGRGVIPLRPAKTRRSGGGRHPSRTPTA